jgi:hypothetical protein
MKELASLIFTVAFIVLVLSGMNAVFAVSCEAQWEGTFPTKYSFFGGCKIQLPDGKWIPSDNYREVK